MTAATSAARARAPREKTACSRGAGPRARRRPDDASLLTMMVEEAAAGAEGKVDVVGEGVGML